MRQGTKIAFCTLVLLAAPLFNSAYAAVAETYTNVTRTMVDSENFGTCMVLLTNKPATLDCGSTNWVTASCSGDFNSSSVGWKKFEQAQMALALDQRVRVFVDDALKHNGKCFLSRIDVLGN